MGPMKNFNSLFWAPAAIMVMLWPLSLGHSKTGLCLEGQCSQQTVDISLLQHPTVNRKTAPTSHGQLQTAGKTCAALKNRGSFFTVPVCVGTPAQCFDVIPDTGSDSVIVPSCICGETPGAGCEPSDKCFEGTAKSSTFSIEDNPELIEITFGSGTIIAVVAKDVVSVGGFNATIDGVLLMVDKAALTVAPSFEGILGLGVPKDKEVVTSLIQGLVHAGHSVSRDQDQSDPLRALCSLKPSLCDGLSPFNRTGGWMPDVPNSDPPGQGGQHGADASKDATFESTLFLQQASVDRFSMCFRDGAQTGALHLGLSPFSSSVQNVGRLHWALDFQGLSVGPHAFPAPTETIFCGPETMKQGMETPCGIIPDSGTTQIVGPKEQVSSLEAGLCSRWERCQTHSKGMPSSEAYRGLLLKCGDWLTDEKGLFEIPSLFMHVKNGDGKPEAFELTAWSWVTQSSSVGLSGSLKKTCESSFGPMEYITEKNGPVWIFGQPLFYEYTVGYDMSTKQISLQKGQCEPCSTEGGPIALSENGGRRWPRAAHGEPRIPYYNVNLPL